jgi:hypothetical protein
MPQTHRLPLPLRDCLRSWLSRLGGRRRRRPGHRPAASPRRPVLETLEDRLYPGSVLPLGAAFVDLAVLGSGRAAPAPQQQAPSAWRGPAPAGTPSPAAAPPVAPPGARTPALWAEALSRLGPALTPRAPAEAPGGEPTPSHAGDGVPLGTEGAGGLPFGGTLAALTTADDLFADPLGGSPGRRPQAEAPSGGATAERGGDGAAEAAGPAAPAALYGPAHQVNAGLPPAASAAGAVGGLPATEQAAFLAYLGGLGQGAASALPAAAAPALAAAPPPPPPRATTPAPLAGDPAAPAPAPPAPPTPPPGTPMPVVLPPPTPRPANAPASASTSPAACPGTTRRPWATCPPWSPPVRSATSTAPP